MKFQQRLPAALQHGIGWSAAGTAGGRLWSVLAGVVLARVLVPSDYGVFAVALVALAILTSVNDLGVPVALIRMPSDAVRQAAPTALTIAVVSSVVLFLACWLAAPYFASLLGAPQATGVVRLLSVGVLIDGVSGVPAALLTREFMQGRRTASDWTSMFVATVLSLGLAVTGHGPWSLAWGRLAGNLAGLAVLLALTPFRPRPGFDTLQARELVAYAGPLAGASLLMFAMLNVDSAIVGHALGAAALGFYTIAVNMSGWPSNLLTATVRRVSIAGLGRLHADTDSLADEFGKALTLLMALTLPACAMLAALADPLVRFLYGDRWGPAAEALRFLAVVGAARVAAGFCYDLLAAAARSRAALVLQAIWIAALVPALAIGVRLGGIQGAAAAHAGVALLVVAPAFTIALAKSGIRPWVLARGLGRPLSASLVGGGLAAIGLVLVPGGLLRLSIAGIVGGAAYVVVWTSSTRVRGWGAATSPPSAPPVM